MDGLRRKWYNRCMDRKRITIRNLSDRRNDDFIPGSVAYRIGLVWPLTREAASLSKRHDAERRLQRHVARVVRREG